MARKFGNHLFRNREALASEHARISTSDLPETFGALDEQVIILGKEDIRAEAPSAPLLDWSPFEKGIAVQLKDTEGLDVGSVTIKASTLQRIHPALLPVPLESEYLFPISLKTVVLQVQAHLRQGSEERPNPTGPDFDTPIAQVAREDNGFFKLAKMTEAIEPPVEETVQAEPKIPEPMLTPADRPTSPMLRKNFPPENRDSQAFSVLERTDTILAPPGFSRDRSGACRVHRSEKGNYCAEFAQANRCRTASGDFHD